MYVSFFRLDIYVVDVAADRPCTSYGPRMIFHDDPLTLMLENLIPLENEGPLM